MNRNRANQLPLRASLLVAALLTAQAQSVKLQYDPEAGVVLDVVETVTRVTTAGGADPVTDVRQRKSLVRPMAVSAAATGSNASTATTTPTLPSAALPKSTAFSNEVKIVSQSLTRDGSTVVSPLHAALVGLDLVYNLDANGKLLTITGYEKLDENMAARLPDKLASTLLKLVNADSLRYRDRASYEEVYGPFTAGSVTAVGNAVSAASQALPHEGWVPLYAVATIETVDAGNVRVRRTFNSDAAALAKQFEGLDEATITAAKGTLEPMLPQTYASASVTGSEEVLLQVDGILVTSRMFRLASEWTLKAPAGTTPATHRVEETREFVAVPLPASVPGVPAPKPAP